MKRINLRQRTLLLFAGSLLLLAAVLVAGLLASKAAMATDFTRKNLPPSAVYPFGTDWMGRDMLLRTLSGLSMSIRIGLLTATVSAAIAFCLGAAAAVFGKGVDAAISWAIDLMMGIPHMLLLILVSFAVGKGFQGVVVGIMLTHWMSLARLIRGEILQLRGSTYVQAAQKLGVGRLQLVRTHMAPHLLPQLLVGLVLLFPHAILHEAGITFLGFGLPPEQPAIGIILSEAMQHLAAGRWWLAVFPGASLVAVVLLFDAMGNALRRLIDPASLHR